MLGFTCNAVDDDFAVRTTATYHLLLVLLQYSVLNTKQGKSHCPVISI